MLAALLKTADASLLSLFDVDEVDMSKIKDGIRVTCTCYMYMHMYMHMY